MGIKFDQSARSRNWLDTLFGTAGVTVSLIELNPFHALSSLRKSIRGLRKKDASEGQVAWTLFTESLTLAVADWVIRNQLYSDKAFDVSMAVSEFIDEINPQINAYEVESSSLAQPWTLPIFPNAVNFFCRYYNASDESLKSDLDIAFTVRWRETLFSDYGYFSKLTSALRSDAALASDWEFSWSKYHDTIRRSVEEDLLFGQGEDGVSLADIFTPLRCTWKCRINRKSLSRKPTIQYSAHVGFLHDELKSWIKKLDRQDEIRVVTGGPGSGKSSTAKMFAAELLRSEPINVFIVPLQGIDITGDVPEIIEQYVAHARAGADALPENPVRNLRSDRKPLLLIFDGLDEVKRPDAGGDDVTRKFVGKLRQWLRLSNTERSNNPILSIVLGRPGAAETAAKEVDLASAALLRVAPLNPMDDRAQSVHFGSDVQLVEDNHSLLKLEQRGDYWTTYAIATGRDTELPSKLLGAELSDLTCEPLLLYLLIFSGYLDRSETEADEAVNRNIIYQMIFERLHDRDVKDKISDLKTGINLESFFILMECLGAAAWREGGRTGSHTTFVEIRDEIYAPKLAKEFKSLPSASLHNVALQFYTQPASDVDSGYEFIHKSFGEYLTARALLKYAIDLVEQYEYSGRIHDALERWIAFSGPQPVQDEHVDWMIREASIIFDSNNLDDLKRARSVCSVLSEFASEALRVGFPAHRDVVHGNWAQRNNAHANAEFSLFAVLHCFVETAFPINKFGIDPCDGGWDQGPVEVEFGLDEFDPSPGNSWHHLLSVGERDKFGTLCLRLNEISSVSNRFFTRFSFRNVKFSSTYYAEYDFAFCDFSEASIVGCGFRNSRLTNCKFDNAIAAATDFARSDLYGASFENTDLSSAKFQSLSIKSQAHPNTMMLRVDVTAREHSVAKGITSEMFENSLVSLDTAFPGKIYDKVMKTRKY